MNPDPKPPHARWTLPQVVLVATVVAALPAASLLRSFHDSTPHLFPGPLGSILALGTIALLAVHAAIRGRGGDIFPAPDARTGLSVAMILPLVIVVLAEKWLTTDLLGEAFSWIPTATRQPAMADALYRLWTGLALLGFGLAATWLLRQIAHRLLGMLTWPRLTGAAWLLAVSAAVPLLISLGVYAAAPGALLAVVPLSSTLAVAVLAQVVRGAAEEFYFRGLLQTGLARLLAQTPLGDGRIPRLASIALVSLAFTLEHASQAAAGQQGLRQLAFVFGISCALGALLAVSRNLYLVIGVHTLINLIVSEVIPLPVNADGDALVPTHTLAVLVLVVAFVGIAMAHRRGVTTD